MPAAHLLAYSIPQYVAALSVVLTRCWARSRRGHPYGSFGTDDWAMISALVFATFCFVFYMLQIWLGLGSRVELLEANAATYHQLLMFRFFHQVSVVIALGLVKVSICLFLQRLVAKNKWYTRALWPVIVIMTVLTLVSVGTITFQCAPIRAAWDYNLRPPPFGEGDAKCFSNSTFTKLGLGNGIFHIVTDILLALLPIPIVMKLKVTISVRISLVLILSLGAFAAIAGIVRQTKACPLDEYDAYSIWNFLELHMGMIAASLPSLKKLLAAIWGTIAARPLERTGAAGTSSIEGLTGKGWSDWEASIVHGSLTGSGQELVEVKSSSDIYKETTVTVSRGTVHRAEEY